MQIRPGDVLHLIYRAILGQLENVVKNIYPEGGTFVGMLGHMPFLLTLWTLSFPKDSKKCPFFKMGLRTQSIKTGKKLSIFSKELMFVVAETTFVFEKEEKEEEVLQKKK